MQGRAKPMPVDLFELEFTQEKASALGRLGRSLEAALAALAEFDADSNGASSSEHPKMRACLVAKASVALWHLVVQREACGLRGTNQVLRDYGVPREVGIRMGAASEQPGVPRKAGRRT